MNSKRRNYSNYLNSKSNRIHHYFNNGLTYHQNNNRTKYYYNYDKNKHRRNKRMRKKYYNNNYYYYNDEQSDSYYNENVFEDKEYSDYENEFYEEEENNINEKKIEFKEVKESILKKFYEEHYENLVDKIKDEEVNNYSVKEEEITMDKIFEKCKEQKYIISEDDKKMLNEMKIEERNNISVEYYNKFMFFTKEKKSIYVPHILKKKSNICSVFLKDKKLTPSDFQITFENNNLFYNILIEKLRIINSNNYNKEITHKEFGITTSQDGTIGFLYTTINEDFVREFFLKEDLNGKKVFGSISNYTKPTPTDFNLEDINDNYIKGLSNEELILLNIYQKIGQNNITKYPRLLLYESNCFINGEAVLKYMIPGYQEVDCIIQSHITTIFPSIDTPFYLQKEYEIKNMNIEEVNPMSISLTIEKNKIYMFEIKSSFPKNLIEIIRKMIKNVVTFKNIFIRENLISAKDEFEVILIYDTHKTSISSGISKLIGLNNLYGELEGLKIKIVYCRSTYVFGALYSLQSKICEIETELRELRNELNNFKRQNNN